MPLAAALLASPAQAAEPTSPDAAVRRAARELAYEGIEHLERQNWENAFVLLDRAYRLVPAPTIGLLRGRALEKLGRLVEAAESYDEAARHDLDADASAAFKKAKLDAAQALQAVQPRIPKLVIEVSDGHTSALVTLDGKPVPAALIGLPRPTDPGKHRVALVAAGTTLDEQVVSVAEGEQRRIVLGKRAAVSPAQRPQLPSAPPVRGPPVSPQPAERDASDRSGLATWGWIGLGVGAAGMGTGLIAGALMLDKESELASTCPAERCPEGARDDVAAHERAKTVATIGYVAGAVGIAAGTTLLVISLGQSSEVSAFIGPGSAGVKGRF